ncbi:MAG: AI-2E family transporter, partial [Lentisphaerota bacterium]
MMNGLIFGERQKRVVAAAVTVFSALIMVLAVALILVLLTSFLSFFSNVFLPLAVAGILALLLKPLYQVILRVVRVPVVAAILAMLAALLPLILALWFFGAVFFDQLSALMDSMPSFYEKIKAAAQQRIPALVVFWNEHGLTEQLSSLMHAKSGWIAERLTSVGNEIYAVGTGIFYTLAGLV